MAISSTENDEEIIDHVCKETCSTNDCNFEFRKSNKCYDAVFYRKYTRLYQNLGIW